MKSPKYHAYQMRILKDKEFDAKLIGVDVNGFCFIQVYNTYIQVVSFTMKIKMFPKT